MKRIQMVVTALTFLAIGGASAVQAQGRGRQDQPAQDQKGKVPEDQQKARVQEEQQRTAKFRQQLDQRVRAVQQENAELQQQKRNAQFRVQQAYAEQLRQQQQRIQTERDYAHDPYVTTPHNYRYRVGGELRETNQYGVNVLRQSVNYGYQQGYNTGRADREDRSPPHYQNSPAYRDANFGYTGSYIDQPDYNYYFREGFVRGYEDGYYSRWQYGSAANGISMAAGVLTGILGLQTIR